MSPNFKGFLGCVQIKVFSSVMIECASNLEEIPCFVPIHCLPNCTKNKIETIITSELTRVLGKAETRKWNGKTGISSKMQDIIDPFLASIYNTYSLSAGLTDPYQDSAIPPPDILNFTINVKYIPEGEKGQRVKRGGSETHSFYGFGRKRVVDISSGTGRVRVTSVPGMP